MARISSTLDVILLRVLDRLVATVPGATVHNTYLSTVSTATPPNPDEVMFEVSPSHNYSFDQDEFTGAGEYSLHTITQILVTVHLTHQLDEAGRDTEYLTNDTLGAIKRITDVLKALTNHDLQDTDGNEILAQPLRPSQGQIPPKDNRSVGYVTILWETEFDWDLTG